MTTTTNTTPPTTTNPFAESAAERTTTTKFNHSVKVPIQYKTAAKLLKTNFEKGVSLKELIFKEKHAVSVTSEL